MPVQGLYFLPRWSITRIWSAFWRSLCNADFRISIKRQYLYHPLTIQMNQCEWTFNAQFLIIKPLKLWLYLYLVHFFLADLTIILLAIRKYGDHYSNDNDSCGSHLLLVMFIVFCTHHYSPSANLTKFTVTPAKHLNIIK